MALQKYKLDVKLDLIVFFLLTTTIFIEYKIFNRLILTIVSILLNLL